MSVMTGWGKRSRQIAVLTLLGLLPFAQAPSAAELHFDQAVSEARTAIEEARRAQADQLAPDDFRLALADFSQMQEQLARAFAREQAIPPTVQEQITRLATRATWQARLAEAKAREVRLRAELTTLELALLEPVDAPRSVAVLEPLDTLPNPLRLKAKRDDLQRARAARARAAAELEQLRSP